MHWRWIGLGTLAVALSLVLGGCASSGAGGSDGWLQVHEDAQRGIKTVAFDPQPMACARQPQCPVLGVRWSSVTPGRAVLLMGFETDSGLVDHASFHTSTYGVQRVQSVSREDAAVAGMRAFDVPMATLERIAFSKDVWVSVHAGDDQVQQVLHNTQESSRADEALKRLMVEAYKGTDKEVQLGLSGLFADPSKR